MTAFSAAFAKAGISQQLAEWRVATSKVLNSGGTIAQLRAELDAIERLSVSGQTGNSIAGQGTHAASRRPVEDGGAAMGLPNGHSRYAQSSSSNHDERGRLSDANGGQSAVAPSRRVPDRGGDGLQKPADVGRLDSAVPVREPTQQQRIASQAVAKLAAITIMDTLKIDGRPVGSYTVSEARQAGKLKTREGYILLAAARTVANAVGHELLREVVKANEMQKIIQKAAEVADAV